MEIQAPIGGRLKKWYRAPNKTVRKGDKLLSIRNENDLDVLLYAKCGGTLSTVYVSENSLVTQDVVLGIIELCQHPALLNLLCVACGEKVISKTSTQEQPKSTTIIMPGGSKLELYGSEAEKIEQAKLNSLKVSRKLALVLDIDHTLLHAAPIQVPPSKAELVASDVECLEMKEDVWSDGKKRTISRFHLVKLRPHLRYFLTKANDKYQLSIYTAGTRKYAEGVVKVLDPDGTLFQARIMSRSDGANDGSLGTNKSLDKVFLGDASMAVIMDDTENAWRGGQAAQLLLVKAFEYFRGHGEVNNGPGTKSNSHPTAEPQPEIQIQMQAQMQSPVILLSGPRPGKTHQPTEVAPVFPSHNHFPGARYDDQLIRCLDVLDSIHTQYYQQLDAVTPSPSSPAVDRLQSPHVGTILSSMKASVLQGCRLTFSGIISTKDTDPRGNLLWRLAVSLGAIVTSEIKLTTTHVIALKPDTSKVKTALRRGDVWVLHADWLAYCRWSLSRAAEATFLLVELPAGKPLPNPVIDPSRPRSDSECEDLPAVSAEGDFPLGRSGRAGGVEDGNEGGISQERFEEWVLRGGDGAAGEGGRRAQKRASTELDDGGSSHSSNDATAQLDVSLGLKSGTSAGVGGGVGGGGGGGRKSGGGRHQKRMRRPPGHVLTTILEGGESDDEEEEEEEGEEEGPHNVDLEGEGRGIDEGDEDEDGNNGGGLYPSGSDEDDEGGEDRSGGGVEDVNDGAATDKERFEEWIGAGGDGAVAGGTAGERSSDDDDDDDDDDCFGDFDSFIMSR